MSTKRIMKSVGTILATAAISILPLHVTASVTVNELRDRTPTLPSIDTLPGEQIDARTTRLTWEVTDLRLPGNGGLDILVNRSYNGSVGTQYSRQIGNWDLEIPRLTWTYRGYPSSYPMTDQPYNFSCTEDFNDGNFGSDAVLKIPGQASRSLLKRTNSEYPSAARYVTTDHWLVECKADYDGSGEGYVVTAPNGMKYFLTEFQAVRAVRESGRPSRQWLYASKVETPAGRYIEYHFDAPGAGCRVSEDECYVQPRLEKITTDDGREVTFVYEAEATALHSAPPWPNPGGENSYVRLKSVTANGQTISYQYQGATWLEKVVLPSNGGEWVYDYGTAEYQLGDPAWDGRELQVLDSVTLPTGAVIEYEWDSAATPMNLFGGAATTQGFLPMTKRTLKVSGIADYVQEFEHTNTATQMSLEVTRPETIEVFTFNRQASNWKAGLLERSEVFLKQPNGDRGNLIREADYDWHNAGPAGAAIRGTTLSRNRVRVLEKVTFDQSNDHKIEYSNFDNHGFPADRMDKGDLTRTYSYTYFNHSNYDANDKEWLIGLPQSTSIMNSGGTLTYLTLTNTYNSLGQVLAVDRNGIKEHYEYWTGTGADKGELRYRKWSRNTLGGSDIQTEYSDYKAGIPRMEVHPEGKTILRVVNDTGTVEAESITVTLLNTNSETRTTSYVYDDLNRVIQITPPAGLVTTITRPNPNTETTTRGTFESRVLFDGMGREVERRHRDTSSSNTTSYVLTEYDKFSRQSFQSIATDSATETRGTSTTYDELGRVASMTRETGVAAEDSTQTYCYNDIETCSLSGSSLTVGEFDQVVTDGRGYQKWFKNKTYGDPDQRVLYGIAENGVQSPSGWTSLDYYRDPAERLVQVHQNPAQLEYEYNAQNLLESQENREEGITSFTYDAAGNLKTKRLNNVLILTHTYDDLNRLLSTNYADPGTPDVSYTYYEDDSVKTVDNSSASWTYSYTENGLLESEEVVISGTTYGTTYSYDNQDALSSITAPTGKNICFLQMDLLSLQISALMVV